jgi:hypothetical protein
MRRDQERPQRGLAPDVKLVSAAPQLDAAHAGMKQQWKDVRDSRHELLPVSWPRR